MIPIRLSWRDAVIALLILVAVALAANGAPEPLQRDSKTNALIQAALDLKSVTLTLGNVTISDAAGIRTITLGSTNGTKIGATGDKIGFLGANTIVRPSSTTDLRQALINLGLYTTGGASPLNLNGGAFTASTISGAAGTFSTTLGVTGNTTLGGTLSLTGAFTGSSLTLSGNETVGGILNVTGASNLHAIVGTNETLSGTFAATGNSTFGGTLGITGALSGAAFSFTGNGTVGGTFGVTGATTLNSLSGTNGTFSGTFHASGTSTFGAAVNVTGDTSIGGLLDVTNEATFASDVAVAGGETVGLDLGVTRNVTVGSALSVTGASTLHAVTATTGAFSGLLSSPNVSLTGGTLSGITSFAGGSMSLTGNETVGGTFGVTGNGTVGGTFGVTGTTSLSTVSTSGLATLNSASVTNNSAIGGNETIAGKITVAGLGVVKTLSPEDYGVVGDGTTNNDAAITALLAAVPSTGAIINFGRGTFLLTNITIPFNNVHIRGAGIGLTTLKRVSGTPTASVITSIQKDYWSVKDLTIDFRNPTLTSTPTFTGAIAIVGSNHWSVSNCELIHLGEYGVFVGGGNYWLIDNNYMSLDTPTGIVQNQCVAGSIAFADIGNARITRNTCLNTGILFSGHDTVIDGNRITGTKYGSGIALNQDASTYRNVVSSNFCASGRGVDANTTIVTGYELWGLNHIIVNNVAFDNDGTGFDIGSAHSIITGNAAINNGKLSPGSDGFVIRYQDATYNSNYATVTANIAYDTLGASGTQRYGLEEQNTSVTGVNYFGNTFTGNKIGEAVYLGTGGSHAFKTTATVDFGSTAYRDPATVGGISVAGVATTDQVFVAKPPAFPAGVLLFGEPDATNSVRLTMLNFSGSTYDPASTTFTITISR